MRMKDLFKILILILGVTVLASAAYAGTPHTVWGSVTGAQTDTSCAYKFYVIARPTDLRTGTLDESGGNYFFLDNAGNFTNPWTSGDNSNVIIWKENNAGAIGHTGYYAISNDSLAAPSPQQFPDTELRAIPVPTATVNATLGRVDLDWGDAVGTINRYNVYRSTDGISFTQIGNSTTSDYSDTSGTAAENYYYAIEIRYAGAVVAGSGTEILSANSNQVTYPDPVSTPSLSSATPASGDQGETLTSVAIVGLNTSFDGTSTIDFGVGITHGDITITDATHLSVADVVISDTAALGIRSVSVTTGSEIASGDIFTVTGTTTVTSTMIDSIDGTEVDIATGYWSGDTDTSEPVYARQTGTIQDGTHAMEVYYTYTAGWGGYWGGSLINTDLNITDNGETHLEFYIWGDGSGNTIAVELNESDASDTINAEAWGHTATYVVTMNSSDAGSWRRIQIPLSAFTIRNEDGGAGDGSFSGRIQSYTIKYTGHNAVAASTYHYIDSLKTVVASTTEGPSIIEITPTEGPAGTVVTITGDGFGASGDINFAREDGTESTSVKSTSSVVTIWDTGQITFTLPAMSAGTREVTVLVDGIESNAVDFIVTATPPAAGIAYNYPNPFNPNGGETTQIVFNPGIATTVTVYVFDMTAQMTNKLVWDGTINPDGTASVVWDGRTGFGEIVGDGVYLYRVVDESNKLLGKGKILAVNR